MSWRAQLIYCIVVDMKVKEAGREIESSKSN